MHLGICATEIETLDQKDQCSLRAQSHSSPVRICMAKSQMDHDCVCRHTALNLIIHELQFVSYLLGEHLPMSVLTD